MRRSLTSVFLVLICVLIRILVDLSRLPPDLISRGAVDQTLIEEIRPASLIPLVGWDYQLASELFC